MPFDGTAFHSTDWELKSEQVEPIYNLDDPRFAQKLDFRPHKPGPGYLDECKKIPRFYGFKTLSQADLKERKRVPVADSEFQNGKPPSNVRASDVQIPIYKGSILEKRQQSLTGKETFNVYEIYTLWEESDSKTGGKRLKEVCIRWDEFNGRVQLYALVYMVHPNKKAESGKFLEMNGLVGLSMVPHKDNPKKVATGGNWAGQGYWVPYVVALYYARQWSVEYAPLFVPIWGNAFPGTCKRSGDQGYRDNILAVPVIAAAKRESEYFFRKAMGRNKELELVHVQPCRKRNVRGNVLIASAQTPTAPHIRSQEFNPPQTFFLKSSLELSPQLQSKGQQSFPTSVRPSKHSGIPPATALRAQLHYDPIYGSRIPKPLVKWAQSHSSSYSEVDKKHLHKANTLERSYKSGLIQKETSHSPSLDIEAHPDEWEKRKRCREEAYPCLSRGDKQHSSKVKPQTKQPNDYRHLEGSISRLQNRWRFDEYARSKGTTKKDWQMQEHEAAAALMLLAGNEAALLGRAAITA